MESENSSNSDDSQSNNSSRSASPDPSPDNVNRDQSGSGSPSASSHNSAPQSPDNNTSGSQSIDGNGLPSPECDDQSADSSSTKSKSLVDESCSPEHQNDEQQSPSSSSSSSSRASSEAGSPDRNSNSRASSKASSRSNLSEKEPKEPFNNYLSDVSDEDSMDNINDEINDNTSQKSAKEWKSDNDTNSLSKDNTLPVNGHNNIDAKLEPNVVNDPAEEPLDFEAEDGEDGECDDPKPVKEDAEVEEEKEPEELEEGEVSDEGEHRPEETEPRPVCRFYSRGQCTWGANCRFLHPGVTDKGNYSMFEMVRPGPIPPPLGLPFYPPDPYRQHERPLIPGVPLPPIKKDDVPPVESAWERGLRQAKEILKKSNKKKENDIDFEEKKMNLTSNQEEVEKENDYYAQRPISPTASPAISPPIERFKPELEARHHRAPHPDAYVDDFVPPPVEFYPHRPEFWPPHHGRPLPHFPPGHPMDFHAAPRRNPYYPYPPPDPYYHPGLKPHHRGLPPKYPPNREVIMQRSEKSYSPQPSGHRNRRDRSLSRPRRGDDWADPWMRSKSPGGRSKLRGRKKSYSSHSSFSSSRSSTSSSASSYSSRSRSRGRSNSMAKNRKKPPPQSFKPSPGRKPNRKPERNPSPDGFEKKNMSRSMNPPVPTNRWSVSPTNSAPSIPPLQRSRQMPMPPRFAVNKLSAVKSPASTHTSTSSSSSESVSGTGSSESSDSSGSESSSEEGGSPKQKTQGMSPDKLLKKGSASKMQKFQKQNMKNKMTVPLLPAVKKDKTIQGKKRPLDFDNEDTKILSPRKKGVSAAATAAAVAAAAAAAPPSRREELLKQLKAVEDAIARKKSKVTL